MTAVENAAIRELAEEVRGLTTQVSAARDEASQARAEVAELKLAVAPAVVLAGHWTAITGGLQGIGRTVKWGAGVGSGIGSILVVLKLFGVL